MGRILSFAILLLTLACAPAHIVEIGKMSPDELKRVNESDLLTARGFIPDNPHILDEIYRRNKVLNNEIIESVSNSDLCEKYNDINWDKVAVKNELIKRKLVNSNEWELIDKNELQLGLSECALVASWGKPNKYGTINTSVYEFGTHKQYVYRNSLHGKPTYVYTENAKITSWQK